MNDSILKAIIGLSIVVLGVLLRGKNRAIRVFSYGANGSVILFDRSDRCIARLFQRQGDGFECAAG